MPAPDIGYLRAPFELLDNPGKGREPLADEMIVITRPEEARDGAKHAASLIAPRDTTTLLEGNLDLGLIIQQGRHYIEAAHHVDGAILDCKHHRLFGRQREPAGLRIVGKIVRSRLLGQPFAQVPLFTLAILASSAHVIGPLA